MDEKNLSKLTRHADRTFVMLLWAGMVGVLFYGCGRDSSMQLTSNPIAPKVRVSVSGVSGGSGSLVDLSERVLLSGEGTIELSYEKGSAVILKQKSALGSKFVGWNVQPASAAQMADDGRLVISDLRKTVFVEATFEKIPFVTLQIKFKTDKSPRRSNMVRWSFFKPGNKSDTPDGEVKCPWTYEEELKLKCQPHQYPFGTVVEVSSGPAAKPAFDQQRFVLDKEMNVLEFDIDAGAY